MRHNNFIALVDGLVASEIMASTSGRMLSKLLIVPEAIAESALADTLNGLVAIVQGSGEVIPSRTFELLDVERRVTLELSR